MLRESMLRKAAMIVAVLATAPAASPAHAADVFSYLGTTIGRPTFNRPSMESPFPLSDQVVRYHARQFIVDKRTICTVDASQYSTSAGGFDGVIHVYKGSFNPSDPGTNVIAGNDNFFSDESDEEAANFGYSRIGPLEVEPGIPYIIVTSAVAPGARRDSFDRIRLGAGDFQNTVSCDSSPVFFDEVPALLKFNAIDTGNCVAPKGESTCKGGLLGNRFRVAARFRFENQPGDLQDAVVVPMDSNDSALFHFGNQNNWELLVKVVDHCNESPPIYKVLVAGTTNAEVEITVEDTEAPFGNPIPPIINPAGHYFDFRDQFIAASKPCGT